MYDAQREYDTDKAIMEMFATQPTFLEKCLTCVHYFGCDMSTHQEECLEAIAELEAQQQPKSCKGCKEGWEREKQTFHKFYCGYLSIPVHGDFYCNRYKPKEQ